MQKKKLLLLAILCIFMAMSPTDFAYADDERLTEETLLEKNKETIMTDVVLVEKRNGSVLTVKLGEQAQNNLTYAELYAIINDVRNIGNCEITIYEVVEANPLTTNDTIGDVVYEEQSWSSIGNIGRAWYDYAKEIETYKDPGIEREYADEFIVSVARGQEITLEETYSFTVKSETSVEAGADMAKVKKLIGASYTHTITTSQKFAGPSENSKYNSRSYRCRYFANHGIWEQVITGIPSGDITHIYGEYTEYSRYASYSIDEIIY